MSEAAIEVSFIPDPHFFALRSELEKLPLRKQPKWKGFVQDGNGVIHRVYFRNGEMFFKHLSRWIMVRPRSDEDLNDIVAYESPAVEEQCGRLNGAYERGGSRAEVQEHYRLIAEAATGNHRSKPHKVRVPTKAGEPVRA